MIRLLIQRSAVVAVRLLEHGLRSLPPDVLVGMLGGAGRSWYFLSRKRRRTALANVDFALGDRYDDRERRRIARDSFDNFGRTMAEFVLADRLFGTPKTSSRRIRWNPDDLEAFLAETKTGGGMAYAAHLGNWECPLHDLRHRGLTLHPVVRTLDNPHLDALVTRRRGGKVIRKGGAVRQIISAVRKGDWIAFVGDQNAGKHGIFVPFFGLEACTFPTPGLVAARLRRPVWVVACLRRPGGVLDGALLRVPDPPEGLSQDEAFHWVLSAIHERLEGLILGDPGQYTWLHRRWKTRRRGEPADLRTPDYPHRKRRPAPVDQHRGRS